MTFDECSDRNEQRTWAYNNGVSASHYKWPRWANPFLPTSTGRRGSNVGDRELAKCWNEGWDDYVVNEV